MTEDEKREALNAYFAFIKNDDPYDTMDEQEIWLAAYAAGKAASANERNSPELVRLRRIAELSGELRRAQLRNARFWNKPGAAPGKGFEYLKQSQELDALLSAHSKVGE